MIKRKIFFADEKSIGMHLRPAGKIVALASKFVSDIVLKKTDDDTGINAKSIIGIMSLGIPANTDIFFEIDGKDEEEAWEAIKNLIISLSNENVN